VFCLFVRVVEEDVGTGGGGQGGLDINAEQEVGKRRLTSAEVGSFRNSSEEELTSINSLAINDTSIDGDHNGGGGIGGGYNGPFDGRAIALVDSTPSPYDRHALRYKVSCIRLHMSFICVQDQPVFIADAKSIRELILDSLKN